MQQLTKFLSRWYSYLPKNLLTKVKLNLFKTANRGKCRQKLLVAIFVLALKRQKCKFGLSLGTTWKSKHLHIKREKAKIAMLINWFCEIQLLVHPAIKPNTEFTCTLIHALWQDFKSIKAQINVNWNQNKVENITMYQKTNHTKVIWVPRQKTPWTKHPDSCEATRTTTDNGFVCLPVLIF